MNEKENVFIHKLTRNLHYFSAIYSYKRLVINLLLASYTDNHSKVDVKSFKKSELKFSSYKSCVLSLFLATNIHEKVVI